MGHREMTVGEKPASRKIGYLHRWEVMVEMEYRACLGGHQQNELVQTKEKRRKKKKTKKKEKKKKKVINLS